VSDSPIAEVVIPARMESSRLPGKVLADIAGKPMLRHVCERSAKARLVSSVSVATDSRQIAEQVTDWGFSVHMTSPDAPSGTARIASIADRFDADLLVNVQGDQPLVEPQLIDDLIECLLGNEEIDVATPIWRIDDPADLTDPSIAKVVVDLEGRAMYFSRSPVPHVRDVDLRDWPMVTEMYGHYGIYAFKRMTLVEFNRTYPTGPLEQAERLEQIGFLEGGYRIHAVKTKFRQVAVDTPKDLERVRQLVSAGKKNQDEQ
jgi:3-deoxy-manno-octulosonate cytidylyltransferase (CMP-KDO synthetase)